MGEVRQLKEDTNRPLDTLASLICQAQERQGRLYPDEVLQLAGAAQEAVESLLQDMEQAGREALQEAVLETFLAKGNA